MKTILVGSAAALFMASAAYAQNASQPAPPAPAATMPPAQTQAQPAAPATQFTDAQVKQFANLLVAFDKIRAEHAASGATTPIDQDPQAKAKMVSAVESSGLSIEAYNAMATRLRTDDSFNQRVAQHMPANNPG